MRLQGKQGVIFTLEEEKLLMWFPMLICKNMLKIWPED